MQKNPDLAMTAHHFALLREGDSEPLINLDYKIEDWPFKKLLWKNPFITPSVMIKKNIEERFQAGRSDMDDHLLWMEIAYQHGSIPKIMQPLAYIHKAQWGEGGLGSRLWIMEKGELKNFLYLHKAKKIGLCKGTISFSIGCLYNPGNANSSSNFPQ